MLFTMMIRKHSSITSGSLTKDIRSECILTSCVRSGICKSGKASRTDGKIHDYIQEQTGVDTHLYRFPGGSSNQVSKVDIQDLIGYLHDEGIVYYDWNSLSGDAVDASLTPSELNDNILGYVHANAGDSVILMHDLQNNHATIEALPALIQTLKDEGYEICPIDDSTKPVQHVEYKGDK